MKIISLFRSLRSRLTLAFISLAIGPILVVGLVLSFKSISSLKNQAITHQQIEAERISIAVENYLCELERVLELTSKAHGFMSLTRPEQQSILDELIAYENRFEALTLVDSDGNELIRSNRIHVVSQAALGDRINDTVFLQIVKPNNNYFSPVQFDTVTGEPRMTIAIPLQSFQTGDVEFVLFGSVRLKQIWDLLASISHTDQSFFLVDGEGNIIGHPDPSVTLSGQQFQLPVASSGIARGLNGGEVVMATKRLVFGEQSIYIVAQMEIAKALRLSREIIFISLLVVVIALILAAILSSLVIGAIIHPLEHLASIARTIQQGDLDRRVEYGRDDEVGELGRAFNDMTSRLRSTIENLENEITERNNEIAERKKAEQEKKELTIQLQQSQKMEAIGVLAGGIAHDFNNILGAIIGYAEMIQEDSPEGSMVRKDIDQVIKASHRAKDLVKQILAFSHQTETEEKILQPAFIIKEAIKMLRASLPTTIDIQRNIDPKAGLILADPTQIHQIITNLCTNAFHAMEETGGTLTISLNSSSLTLADLVGRLHVQPGNFVEISVRDTGLGIEPEIKGKIFDPFFTTKEVGKGTGMGLAVIHGIVKKAGGFVSCKSAPGEGTTFHVYLPVYAGTAPPDAETTSLELTQTGTERILFIDDEEMLAEMGKATLERLGYRVTVETNSIEALRIIQNQPDRFDLVITDQTMPGMTGSDLSQLILQIRPGMPIILCTGFSNLISEEKARRYGIKGFAMKPLALKDLATLVRKVL